jgi:hypothetical protein
MGVADLQALRRTEEKEVPGLMVRTPRARLLDASEVQKKHPDLHLRFVNILDPEKVEARREAGWKRLTPDEGGKQIGNSLALFGIPRDVAQAQASEYRRQDRIKLDAHRRTMQQAVQEGAKELRDKSGISVDEKTVLIDETAKDTKEE